MDARERANRGHEATAQGPAASSAELATVEPPRYQPLVVVAAALAAGIVLDRYLFLCLPEGISRNISWVVLWGMLVVAALLSWRAAWKQGRLPVAVSAVLLAAMCLGAAWHHLSWNLFDRYEGFRYASYRGGPACLEVVVTKSPSRVPAPKPTPLRAIPGGERTRMQVRLVSIRDGTKWRSASGISQLDVDGHVLGVRVGDRVRVFGYLSRISPPLNPGEFDFAEHARADRELIRIQSSVPESITVLPSVDRWRPERFVHSIRAKAKQAVRAFVGPERADLASAMLLGSRESLTAEVAEPYLLTGTIHVLVVSGMNVAILATGLYVLVRIGWVPRRTGFALIMIVAVGYALVAEGQPPVTRAAIFAVIVCIGAWIGRPGIAFNSLAFAAIFVLALNPSDLFRVGPQLSFLAVAGLIWTEKWWRNRQTDRADPLEELVESTRSWPRRSFHRLLRGTGGLLLTSLVVWLITLPLLLNQFHLAAPVSVIISPLLWVIVVIIMWSGFFMLIVGWLIQPLGEVLGGLCATALGWLERLVEAAERVPGGHFFAPGPALWWVLVFYAALLVLLVRGRAILPRRWQWVALSVWILVGLIPPAVRAMQRDALECSFVAVGHGACVLVESPSGETLLYDAGSLGSPEFATQTIASYLWHRGIMRLDGIVISHADIDHYNAIPGLLERFRVGAIYVSPMMFDGFDDADTTGPRVLQAAIREAGVPIREVWSGDRLKLGESVSLEVFHPSKQGVLGTDNANSITMAVEHGDHRLLLPGDLESPGIEEVMAEVPYDCDVLLAPHHGSRRSDPPGFAAWSMPNWVVLSSGGRDDVLPVVATYQRAGAMVLSTHECGMVHFSLGKGPVHARSWLTEPLR